jgi:GGDEF domain-containing protein
MASPDSSRARRFALPALRDERTEEAIEAFLEGPVVRRPRRRPKAKRPESEHLPAPLPAIVPRPQRPSSDLRAIPGRLEFAAALDREGARAARYGRPVAVVVVDLIAEPPDEPIDPWMRRLSGAVVRALRDGSRATDLVARVATSRFQVLLPETSELSADHYVERIAADCREVMESVGAPLSIRVTVAAAGRDRSLQDALAHALNAIEAA